MIAHMVVSRADRRRARAPQARELFGAEAEAALDILELAEFAWHDCYGEVTPSDTVVEDIFVCSEGRLPALARAARLAVEDWRDLRLWADNLRGRK